jgi:2,4-dienoyl-CoA reductase-like NADH-dependent reductase (Old Yellow Enzyme family)
MSSDTKPQPLFTTVRMGKLELLNRIVMAPLNSQH